MLLSQQHPPQNFVSLRSSKDCPPTQRKKRKKEEEEEVSGSSVVLPHTGQAGGLVKGVAFKGSLRVFLRNINRSCTAHASRGHRCVPADFRRCNGAGLQNVLEGLLCAPPAGDRVEGKEGNCFVFTPSQPWRLCKGENGWKREANRSCVHSSRYIISVRSKTVSMRSVKPICAPSRLSEVSPNVAS